MTTSQPPTMRAWEEAWRTADATALQQQYAPDAVLFAPNKPLVQGQAAILDFFRGGLGKVEVVFETTVLTETANMAFELGYFHDLAPGTRTPLATGHYSVTWEQKADQWQIKCHTWTMPVHPKA